MKFDARWDSFLAGMLFAIAVATNDRPLWQIVTLIGMAVALLFSLERKTDDPE